MRRKDREVKDIEQILGMIEKAKILHLAMFDEPYPYVIPLHFGYEVRDGALVFYMHCAKEGHKLTLLKRNPHVCIELECDVALIPGGDIPCAYGSEFASVVGRGNARILTEEQDKIRALTLLMENQTGQSFVIDRQMAAGVSVIEVLLTEYTAKANHKEVKSVAAEQHGAF